MSCNFDLINKPVHVAKGMFADILRKVSSLLVQTHLWFHLQALVVHTFMPIIFLSQTYFQVLTNFPFYETKVTISRI